MQPVVSGQCRVSFGRASRWRSLRRVLGVGAMAVLLAGCGQAAAVAPKSSATATTASTPTPLPPAPLQWIHTTLPANAASASVAVAPSDGAILYACAAPNDENGARVGQPHVWVTHDFATHWSQAASIPADQVNNGCVIEVDQRDPSIAVAILTWMPPGAGGGPSITDITNYVTFNGGASWRKLTDTHPFEMSFLTGPATRNGVSYAIRGVLSGNAVHNGLWVSSDQMTTWRLIDPPGVKVDAATFWAQPSTGEVLAQYGEPDEPSELWDSRDGGAHWTQINVPTLTTPGPSRNPYLIAGHGSQPGVTICSAVVKVAGAATADPLTCSADDGKTWNRLPTLSPYKPAANSAQQIAFVAGMMSDGSIVAILPADTTNELYRLAPRAAQWQFLGDLAPAMSYSSIAGGDVLWSVMSPLSPIIATTY